MEDKQMAMNFDQVKPEPEPEAPPEQNRDYWDSTGQPI